MDSACRVVVGMRCGPRSAILSLNKYRLRCCGILKFAKASMSSNHKNYEKHIAHYPKQVGKLGEIFIQGRN
jgi:hypothetical protein